MQAEEKIPVNKRNVHKVLAHSYATYFVLFLVGVTLDLVFRFQIFNSSVMVPTGVSVLIFATLLIFWAQTTSRNLKKENITKETFCKGPYCYSRSPTHWGLFFLMLGFGIIVNAIFVVLTTLISFLISRYIFLSKEEAILEEKYGMPYLDYKRDVRLW
jgi:protein-S-isoprenylcysteine O-methyltransferase Ste14